ncbi:MAG: chemotaxis protein CheA [Planctomycetes bacterium]|nr:chemotaxis protein CheA [Planctomycetota bacterium]
MHDTIKLTKLIEQAALMIAMGDEDFSELKKLRNVFVKIDENISHCEFLSPELIKHTKTMTRSASKAISAIIGKKVSDTAVSLNIVSETVSELQKLVNDIGKGANKDDGDEAQVIIPEDCMSMVPDFITEACEHIESAEAGLLELENKFDDKESLNIIFRAFHNIKGAAGFLGLNEVESLAHCAENVLDLARKGQLLLTDSNINLVFESIDMMNNLLTTLKNASESGVPIKAKKNLNELLEKLGACSKSTDTSQIKKNEEKIDKILGDDVSNKVSQSASKFKSGSAEERIRVSTDRLDNLVNMVGEMVITQSMISQQVFEMLSPEDRLYRTVSQQDKILRELQELSMSMRMIPIHGLFQKMTRLVRDLSHKADKDICFTTVGEETELDRNVVEQLADPLVHMVRNSVDHGIESKQERAAAGKNPIASIELRASRRADNIIIEITDDGKGLDKNRILKEAIGKGIVSPTDNLSEQNIYKLIFHPSLSTAREITNVSGRGVGMDVVKKNIEALRGKVDVSTISGKGTTFTISIPLTLAVIDGQIVSVGNEQYIIPTTSIEQSFRPKQEQLSSVNGRGELVSFRGEILPMVRLGRLFGVEPNSEEPTESSLVIVEADGQKTCLLVDKLLGQQQVVIKNIGRYFGNVKGVSGGTIMGDGRISLILDVPGLIELSRNQGHVPINSSI